MTLQPPDDGVKRPYHSPHRQAQAVETRDAILEAAVGLFAEHGFQRTTMKQVAELASVSEQTVYNVVGDKIGLLCAVGEYAMRGTGREERLLLDALQAEPDPMRRIRLAAQFSREQWQEGALELDLMLFNSDHKDPRLVELSDRVLSYKLEVNLAAAQVLFPDEIRRIGVSLDEIAAFATTVDSAATITTLMRLGWTMDQYEDWITRLLALFLDPDRT